MHRYDLAMQSTGPDRPVFLAKYFLKIFLSLSQSTLQVLEAIANRLFGKRLELKPVGRTCASLFVLILLILGKFR